MYKKFLSLTFLGVIFTSSAIAAPNEPHLAMPMLTEPTVGASDDVQHLRDEFIKAYVLAKKPRMAIYYNHEFSGSLEEWITPVRHNLIIVEPNSVIKQAQSSVQIRDLNEANRVQPNESWSWAFEDGFYGTLLNQRVQLVDRSAILRLAAVERSENLNEIIPLKRVEIEALKEHADLIIEVLIDQNGQNFRAKVLTVKTGQLLAIVSASLDTLTPVKTKFFAGEHGYERETVKLEPKALGVVFANEVMKKLTDTLKL